MLEKGGVTLGMMSHAHLDVCGGLVSCQKERHIIVVQAHCHLNALGNLRVATLQCLLAMLTALADSLWNCQRVMGAHWHCAFHDT